MVVYANQYWTYIFFFRGILGWIVVKILRPKPHLEGLIIATCSSGNLGNLLLIIVPAICNEDGSPFGNRNVCSSAGLSYASFSMALGGFFIWTYSYQLVKTSSDKFKHLKQQKQRKSQRNPTRILMPLHKLTFSVEIMMIKDMLP